MRAKADSEILRLGRSLLLIVSYLFALIHTGWAKEAIDPYDVLYDAIMVRKAADGGIYGENALSPLIWSNSRYLLKGDTHERFVEALSTFSALSPDKIESYSHIKRALLQRQLWAVFDWTTDLYIHPQQSDSALIKQNSTTLQKKLVPLIRRLALSEEDILGLPDTMTATIESGFYQKNHDLDDRLKPFFPHDLFDGIGPWVCLKKKLSSINYSPFSYREKTL